MTSEVFFNFDKVPNIILEKFYFVLGFKKSDRNAKLTFAEIKNRMNAFQPESLQDQEIDELYLVYNSRESFRKYEHCEAIVDWICFALEYKFYRDQLAEARKLIPAFNKKIQDSMCKISKMSKEKFICEKKLKDIKKYLDSDKNNSSTSSETSKISRRHYSTSDIRNSNNKTILNIESFADLRLNTDHLYKEDKKKNKNLEIQNIVYENELGC